MSRKVFVMIVFSTAASFYFWIGTAFAQSIVDDESSTAFYDAGAVREEESLKDGKRDGVFTSYYSGGQVKSVGYYRNGSRDGLFKKYHENGQLMFKAQYNAGAIVGLIEMYDEEGNLVRKWEADERQDAKVKPGPSVQGYSLAAGERDVVFDLQKEYYKDGTIKAEKFYKNSRLEGVQKEYDEEGQLRQVLTYKDGELVHQEGFAAENKTPVDAPTNLVECFAVLQDMLTGQEVEQVKRADFEELRDNKYFLKDKVWSLWTDTALTDYFRDLGIYHPDDMGSIVFLTFQKFLNNEEIQLDKQIELFQSYWQDAADSEFSAEGNSANK